MSERPALIERLLARREQHRRRSVVYRIAFGTLGGLILAAGVVMLVTPGPAFVLIPVGLAMLALEFRWAERLLERALEQAEKARVKAAGASSAQKLAGTALGVAAAAAAAFLAFTFVV